MTDPDRNFELVAYHEAGHCVAALALGQDVRAIETTDRGGGACWRDPGRCFTVLRLNGKTVDNGEALDELTVLFAGVIGTNLAGLPCGDERWKSDLAEAVKIAREFTDSDADAVAAVEAACRESWRLLRRRWWQVQRLALGLMVKDRIEEAEIRNLCHEWKVEVTCKRKVG